MRTSLNLLMFFLGFFLVFSICIESYAEDCAYSSSSDTWYMLTGSPVYVSTTVCTNVQPSDYFSGSGTGVRYYFFVAGDDTNCASGYTRYDSYYYPYFEMVVSDEEACNSGDPDHCSNGVKDSGETGVDCGGECANSCTPQCDEGYMLACSGDPVSCQCLAYAEDDEYGNCPSGYSSAWDEDGHYCFSTGTVTLVDSGEAQDSSDPVYSDDTVNQTPDGSDGTTGDSPPDVFSPSTSTSETSSGSTTVDNGDGTSTTTIIDTTTTTTNNKSSTSTTTTTIVTDNSTGGTVSKDSITTSTGSSEDNPENYSYNLGNGEGDYNGSLSDDDIPEEDNITDLWENYLTSNPIVELITGSGISVTGTQCSLSFDYNGKVIEFSMCNDPWPDTLDFMGRILLFLSTVSTYFIIFGKD